MSKILGCLLNAKSIVVVRFHQYIYPLAFCSQAIKWPTFHKIKGYNLTNTGNEKTHVKIPKWPSLRTPSLKNEIL